MAQHGHAMAGIDHHAMGHDTGMEGMGHAGHAGDCPRTVHRLLVLMTITFSGLPVPDRLRMQVFHPDESAVPGVIPDLAAVPVD